MPSSLANLSFIFCHWLPVLNFTSVTLPQHWTQPQPSATLPDSLFRVHGWLMPLSIDTQVSTGEGTSPCATSNHKWSYNHSEAAAKTQGIIDQDNSLSEFIQLWVLLPITVNFCPLLISQGRNRRGRRKSYVRRATQHTNTSQPVLCSIGCSLYFTISS